MSQLMMLLPALPGDASMGPFRRVRDEDAAALARLLNVTFPEVTWDGVQVARDLMHATDVLDVFVADGEDGIVATASGRHDASRFPGVGYVHLVAVHPEAQGTGLGIGAVQAVLAAFRERGFEQAVLETDDDRLSALSGYLRLGFIPVYRDTDHHMRWSDIFRVLARHRSRTALVPAATARTSGYPTVIESREHGHGTSC